MEAGGAKSKKALASKANRSIVASSVALVSPLFVVRSLRPKCCRMLWGKRKGEGGGMLAQSGVAAHIVLH